MYIALLCDCASFVLWLNCGVFVHVYCPSPCVDYPDGGMGFVFWKGCKDINCVRHHEVCGSTVCSSQWCLFSDSGMCC